MVGENVASGADSSNSTDDAQRTSSRSGAAGSFVRNVHDQLVPWQWQHWWCSTVRTQQAALGGSCTRRWIRRIEQCAPCQVRGGAVAAAERCAGAISGWRLG